MKRQTAAVFFVVCVLLLGQQGAYITGIGPTAIGGGGGGGCEPGSTGINVKTGAGTCTARSVTSDGTLTVTNSDGVAGNIQVIAATGVMLSRATDQAGTGRYCRSTTTNDSYTCTLTPTLTTYTRGGCLTLDADTSNTLTATLNVDTLGIKSILNRAGAALASGDITANKPIQICYDGTQYIIQGDGGGASVVAPPNSYDFREEFWPNNNGHGANYIWAVSPNTSVDTTLVDGDHYGVAKAVSNTVNDTMAFSLVNNNADAWMRLDNRTFDSYFIVHWTGPLTQLHFWVGYGSLAHQNNQDMIAARFSNNTGCTNTASDTDIGLVTRSGGGAFTVSSSGVSLTAGDWIAVRIYSEVAGTVKLTISKNGGAWSTPPAENSTLPTAKLFPVFFAMPCDTSGNRTLYVDHFSFTATRARVP